MDKVRAQVAGKGARVRVIIRRAHTAGGDGDDSTDFGAG